MRQHFPKLADDGTMLVMLSGGRDSTALLHLTASLFPDQVHALHVNYGMRVEADTETAQCESLCKALGVPLRVYRTEKAPDSNVQEWAREQRYRVVKEVHPHGPVLVAHTATDQVETIVYRFARHPGRKGLLGMKESTGRIHRPLLMAKWTREDSKDYCNKHGLVWSDDKSNDTDKYARGRIRNSILPQLRELADADNVILQTQRLLQEEDDLLKSVVKIWIASNQLVNGIDASKLRAELPALRRLTLQQLADSHMDGAPSLATRADDILALTPGSALSVGRGLRARMGTKMYPGLRFETQTTGRGAPTHGAGRLHPIDE